MTDLVRLRHKHTRQELDVPAAAVPFFPDYEPVPEPAPDPAAPTEVPAVTDSKPTGRKGRQTEEDATDGR